MKFVVPKSQHFDLSTREKLVALFVLAALSGKTVAAPVQFDGELGLGAIEIENV